MNHSTRWALSEVVEVSEALHAVLQRVSAHLLSKIRINVGVIV